MSGILNGLYLVKRDHKACGAGFTAPFQIGEQLKIHDGIREMRVYIASQDDPFSELCEGW